MFETVPSRRPLLASVFVGTLGIILCALSALQKADALCVTTGCALFKEFTIAGISAWWFGLTAFSLNTLLSLLGRRQAALLFATLFLLADMCFLLIMAFSAPCVPCLLAAVLFALQYISIAGAAPGKISRAGTALLVCWFFVVSPNMFSALDETFGIWTISGPENADMRLFFSPSCAVCLKAVPAFASNPENNVAFIPVAESAEDERTILLMNRYLAEGNTMYAAFRRATKAVSPAPASLLEMLRVQWHLYRNKAHLMQMGVDRIPVLVTNGLPESLYKRPAAGSRTPAYNDAPATELLQEHFAGCGGATSVPCE